MDANLDEAKEIANYLRFDPNRVGWISYEEADHAARMIDALIAQLSGITDETSSPFDRDHLGRFVREAWVRWAQTQPNPKASWLLPYDELSEPDKEADRQIGEAVARWTLIGHAARSSLTIWQPIETARKVVDETVLLRVEHVNYAIAPPEDKHRWEEVCSAYWTDFNSGGWVWHGLAGSPTHWMPIPPLGAHP